MRSKDERKTNKEALRFEAMTENKEKPYLSIAALCERALQEKDGVISGIRFVDKLIITAKGAEASEKIPELPFMMLSAIIAFKSGPARGKRTIQLRLCNPKGELLSTVQSHEAVFKGDENGVNLIVNIALQPKEEGLYWVDVLLDDEVITRIPLRVEYVREPD
ncbi:MAG: DUF6941 family protein [Blastocatellia bacterium]